MERWNAFLQELLSTEIRRRSSFKFPEESALALQFFGCASSCTYGAVACLGFKSNSEFKCSFVIGKSRIAPIKENPLTKPKLELQAAATASRIKVKIIVELKETLKYMLLTVLVKFLIVSIQKTGSMYLSNQMLPTKCNSLHTIL